jgi:flavin reductase (DIM6/NTAB) family NADH-FMN oxidoreductase RutF
MSEATGAGLIRFDPGENAPGDIYRLMVGSIVPRPIAFVSSLDAAGVRNLAPFSFFMGVGSNPPCLAVSTVLRAPEAGGRKDTLNNIERTREFVVNIVSEDIAEAMNRTAAEVPPEVDEFALAGLTPLPGERVGAPRVAESPVQMECRLIEIIPTGSQPGAGILVLGEILLLHVRADLVEGFRIDPDRLRAVGRMGGMSYARTRDRFDLERPR